MCRGSRRSSSRYLVRGRVRVRVRARARARARARVEGYLGADAPREAEVGELERAVRVEQLVRVRVRVRVKGER